MFWQVTTVLTWDRTDHLSLEIIEQTLMSQNACFAIHYAQFALVIIMENVKLA